MKTLSKHKIYLRINPLILLSLLAVLLTGGAPLAPAGAIAVEPPQPTDLPPRPEWVRPVPGWNERPAVITPDPAVQEMIDQVESDTLYNYTGALSGEWPVLVGSEWVTFTTRSSGAVDLIEKATQYTYDHFQALGLPVSYHYYNYYPTGTRRNVVAEQAGWGEENCIYLITAHLDSTSPTPYTLAPGADDNASGSAAVLVAADILSRYRFNCTLRYILFTGEEQGLLGSEAYAAEAAQQGDQIKGVLNLDMVAYSPTATPTVEMHIRSGEAGNPDQVISNLFGDVINAYALNLVPVLYADSESASDHSPFWDHGYAAILAIEDWNNHTPYYHTTDDRLSTLNMTYFTNFVKASVGTLAHMGKLVAAYGGLNGVVSATETGLPIAGAQVKALTPFTQVVSTTSNAVGWYQMATAPNTYTVTATAPGFAATTISGVQVTSGQTTTVNLSMPTCYPISGLDFTYTPLELYNGQSATFTATLAATSTLPIQYAWIFGDGLTVQGAVVRHSFTLGGTYATRVTASNCGGEAAAEHQIVVIGRPTIQVSPTEVPATAKPGGTTYKELAIANLGGASLEWQAGLEPPVNWLAASPSQGAVAPLNTAKVKLNFTAPLALGTYTTTLAIAHNASTQPEVRIPVTLVVTSCVTLEGVDFSFVPAGPFTGQAIGYDATIASGEGPINFIWNFGDQSPVLIGEDLYHVTHTYPLTNTTQTYTVSLNVNNRCLLQQTVVKPITVRAYNLYLPLAAKPGE